jgi:hypothetical protein
MGPATNVVRRIEIGVDTPPPSFLPPFERGEFKLERFPIGVDYDVQQKRITEQADCRRQRV